MNGVDPVARIGFAKGAAAYARGRPGYPEAVNGWLGTALHIGEGTRVVEVGAGTGLFTRRLVNTGAAVIAVDPVPAMLGRLQADLPMVETLAASADSIPLWDGSADAIVCATAFHWFATPGTLAEFQRLLRPGGALGLIWNLRDERVPWVAALSAITNRHAGRVVRQRDETWREPFPAPGFSPLTETVMACEHRGTAQEVVIDRTLSTSFIAALDEAARAEVLDEVRALIAATPALQQPVVSFPYLTKACHSYRID